MRNSRLLPYDTIVQATSGEPEAVNTVLQYYGRRIRYASRISGQADKEAEDFITETLLKALFKFRFSRVSPPDRRISGAEQHSWHLHSAEHSQQWI